MLYKAVIFDMDGVIIDSEPIHFRMIKNYLNELGIRSTDEECEIFAGLANKEIFASIKANHSLGPTTEELTAIYESRYLEYLKSTGDEKPIAFVDVLIKDIYNRGIPIALASSASNENISTVLRKFRLDRYFGITISGCDFKKSKPSPDIYFRAAELLGLKPAECVVIEDSTNGIKAAKAAGMACVAYSNPNSGRQDLTLADAVISSFEGMDFTKLVEKILSVK